MSRSMISATRVAGAAVKGGLDPSFPGSDAFLSALGRVIAESALLESELVWWLQKFLGHKTVTAQIVCAELDLRKQLSLLLALARAEPLKPKYLAPLEAVITTLNKLYNQRNDYVHGLWASHESGAPTKRALIRVFAPGPWKVKPLDVDASAIEKTAVGFNVAADDLHRLGEQYDSDTRRAAAR